MALIAKNEGGGSYPPIPAGLHHAVCSAIYDLGTQYNQVFNKSNRQVLIQWELPEIRIEVDGQSMPKATSKKYSLSLHEKSNLRKDLENWRGRTFTDKELEGFDLLKLLGVNCLLQVIHHKKDGKVYARITAVLPLQKGTEKRQAENQLKCFSLEDDNDIPEDTPNWIREIIEDSEEWRDRKSLPSEHDDNFEDSVPLSAYDNIPDDDIPF